jgi:hypothetical protein
LNRFLVEEHEKGRLAVVVVDEAQHLGRDGLEAIRLVSNLETEKSKLLQIVLFGQTELDELLSEPSLRQLNQRVVFSFSTKPLTDAEARRYVTHRIRVSRREGVEYDIFSDEALAVIARRSGGIPRVINIIADKSLLVAFSEGSPTVRREHALEAVKDTPGLVTGGGWTWPAWLRRTFLWKTAAVLLLTLLVAGLAGWYAWRAPPRSLDVAGNAAAAVQATPATSSVPVVTAPAVQPAASVPSAAVLPAKPVRHAKAHAKHPKHKTTAHPVEAKAAPAPQSAVPKTDDTAPPPTVSPVSP